MAELSEPGVDHWEITRRAAIENVLSKVGCRKRVVKQCPSGAGTAAAAQADGFAVDTDLDAALVVVAVPLPTVAGVLWRSTRDPLGQAVSLDGPDALAELRELDRRGDVVSGWK